MFSWCFPAVASSDLYKQFHIRRVIRFPGDRVTRKYQKAAVRRAEYKKLKAIVPAVAGKRSVSKLTVVEEAIRYIDELHSLLAARICGETNLYDRTADAIVRQRCHQQFIDDVIQPNVAHCTIYSSRSTKTQQEAVDLEYDFILSATNESVDTNRKHRRAFNELQMITSNYDDVTNY